MICYSQGPSEVWCSRSRGHVGRHWNAEYTHLWDAPAGAPQPSTPPTERVPVEVSSRKLLITTLEGLASGHSSKEAAKLIGISCEAVRSRRIKLYKTFKVNNASAAVAHGFREHILVPQRTAATTVKFLTPQEITVLQLFADGESRRSAAEKMHLSPLTVKSHLGNATKRCKAKNATHLVALAFHNELIS